MAIRAVPYGMKVIAVIDDDRALREALVRLLKLRGHDAVPYGSAEDFLAADGHPTDCLVLDVQLPGLSGIELMSRLHADGRYVPIVFITGHTDPQLLDTLRETAMPYLRKPFDHESLFDAIARATSAEAPPT
jgi:FixJ family two-component response regulator